MAGRERTVATIALLTGAIVWGIIWYPYRLLEHAGLSGLRATILSYLVALVLGWLLFRSRLPRFDRPKKLLMLALIGLSAGACNLGYVLATLHGEVMRVLLLFYLAPLWTVLWSRLLLKERLSAVGISVIGLSLCGAGTMLWRVELGAPWPANGAEWLGLVAGFMFALSNVLIRRATHLTIEVKSLAVFAGVALLGLAIMPFDTAIPTVNRGMADLQPWHWMMVGLLGLILLTINLVVQHGLTHTPANQAIVILLSELLVAALSSWWLAGETIGLQEWVGGGMIVAASLFSGRLDAST